MKWYKEFVPSLEDFKQKHGSESIAFVIATCHHEMDFSVRTDGRGAAPYRSLLSHVRELLAPFKQAKEIELDWESGSILFTFAKPHEAVKFSIYLQSSLRTLAEETGLKVFDRIAINAQTGLAPVQNGTEESAHQLAYHFGICAKLAGIGQPRQILLNRAAFESYRCSLDKADVKKLKPLVWMHHGRYTMPESEEPVDLCEVGEEEVSALSPPRENGDLRMDGSSEAKNGVWGWRPGLFSMVPETRCLLQERHADSEYGEVWMGVDLSTKEQRSFRFCFRRDRLDQLREQADSLATLKNRVSQDRNVLSVKAISLESPPFYIMTEYFEGKDLRSWCQERGGIGAIPLMSRLEIIAQAASGLSAAHEAKVLHKRLCPEAILVAGSGESPRQVQVKLRGFGIAPASRVETKETASETAKATELKTSDSPCLAGMYAAPELGSGHAHSTKSDTYSLGIILAQLVQGDFSQGLPPERIKEVLSVFKKEELLSFFAESVEERTDGAGRFAREIFSLLKKRNTAATGQAETKKRRLYGVAGFGLMLILVIAAMWNLLPAPATSQNTESAATNQADVAAKPAKSFWDFDFKLFGAAEPEEGTGFAGSGSGRSAQSGSSQSSYSSPNQTDKEEENPMKVLVNFLLLPILAVSAIGGLFQWVIPKLFQKIRGVSVAKPHF